MRGLNMADGLDGVIAAETEMSLVDGQAGRLVIRGRDVEEFADGPPFEEIVALLIGDRLDDLPPAPALRWALGRARVEAFARIAALPTLTRLEPMDAMRAALAQLPDGEDAATALLLLATAAVMTSYAARVSQGLDPIAPDPEADHAADLLRMLGASADPDRARALSAYLAVVSDHGLNASTFTARVVASTRAGLTSSITAACGALKGPLHGGAPGPVIDMLDAIGSSERAEPWIMAALDRGERLMGFGHRIYRVRDPRADALKRVIAMRLRGGSTQRMALAEAVEAVALTTLRQRKPDRRLDTNVEFYTALLLEALGFPPAVFTCVFTAGRAAGWIGHALEQQASGRLIRPESRYVGPLPSLAA
jgi:citrate synthase